MNKKLIIGILILLIILITGSAIVADMNKADTEIPNINTHIQKANEEYNMSVTYLNKKNYTQATTHINSSYTEYIQAHTSTQKALSKAINNNQSLQIEYLNYTLTELDHKINATVEMYNGILTVPNSPTQALKYFDNSNKHMQNATTYSDKRKLLEEQNPDKFIK